MLTRRKRMALVTVFVAIFGSLMMVELGMRIRSLVTGESPTVIVRDDLLGWKLKPRARRWIRFEEQPYEVRINSRGLRDEERGLRKPKGGLRMIVLGDSFVFGSGGVDQHKRFTDLLEAGQTDVEVINCGVPGYSLEQEFLWLRQEGLEYDPDVVMVCAFWNDDIESFLTYHPKIALPKPSLRLNNERLAITRPGISWSQRICEPSYALSWVERRVAAIRGNQASVPTRDTSDEERRGSFQRLIEAYDEQCRSIGAELIFVYFPFPWGRQTSPTLLQLALLESSQRLGIYFIDFMDYFAANSFEQQPFFATNGHFTDDGHQLVADQLRSFLATVPETETFFESPGASSATSASE